jgi:hypothetical protein
VLLPLLATLAEFIAAKPFETLVNGVLFEPSAPIQPPACIAVTKKCCDCGKTKLFPGKFVKRWSYVPVKNLAVV